MTCLTFAQFILGHWIAAVIVLAYLWNIYRKSGWEQHSVRRRQEVSVAMPAGNDNRICARRVA